MDSEQVLAILRRHKRELRALGIENMSLFGSVATDTGTEDSDIDVAVSLAPGLRGLERIGRLDAVQSRLSDLLGCPVDVVEEPARSPVIRRAIERDGVLAF
jgi:predicted nucleotidyltransferase